jgi:hypothetical protein
MKSGTLWDDLKQYVFTTLAEIILMCFKAMRQFINVISTGAITAQQYRLYNLYQI